MKIIIISDTHGLHKRLKIPKCDLLIHCGDITNRGEAQVIANFNNWLEEIPLPKTHKIVIAGNHDSLFETDNLLARVLLPAATYLEDSYTYVEDLLIYGSPYTPTYQNWSFMIDRNTLSLKEKWDKIPLETDILITHGPPFGVLDTIPEEKIRPGEGPNVGCELLSNRIQKVNPLIHCFGHIHNTYEERKETIGNTTFANAAMMNEYHRPISNMYVEINLGEKE